MKTNIKLQSFSWFIVVYKLVQFNLRNKITSRRIKFTKPAYVGRDATSACYTISIIKLNCLGMEFWSKSVPENNIESVNNICKWKVSNSSIIMVKYSINQTIDFYSKLFNLLPLNVSKNLTFRKVSWNSINTVKDSTKSNYTE